MTGYYDSSRFVELHLLDSNKPVWVRPDRVSAREHVSTRQVTSLLKRPSTLVYSKLLVDGKWFYVRETELELKDLMPELFR